MYSTLCIGTVHNVEPGEIQEGFAFSVGCACTGENFSLELDTVQIPELQFQDNLMYLVHYVIKFQVSLVVKI